MLIFSEKKTYILISSTLGVKVALSNRFFHPKKTRYMMRNLLLIFSLLLFASIAIGQTAIAGKVTDKSDNGAELIGATLVFKKNGNYITGVTTDFDGNFKVNVDPGTYDVSISYLGLGELLIEGVVAKAGQTTDLPVEMGSEGGIILDEIVVREFKVPLIDKDNTTSGQTITSKEIRNLPTKNISALASTAAGLSQVDEGDDVTVRGSRADAVDYYIDGIRVRGALIPESEIEQLQVITGGIGAKYGDVTGGIISITTKGPSSQFGGSVELETSEYLDDFGYNLLNANVSGPILKKKGENGVEESIIGFRFSGRYRHQKDDDPPATPVYRVNDEKLAELQANPIVFDNTGTPTVGPLGQPILPVIASATNLTNEDIDVLGYRPGEENQVIDLTAKIDARLSKNIDITFTGTYNNTQDKFTPGSFGETNNPTWQVINSQNNPVNETTRFRGNFRFRHKLGRQGVAEAGAEAAKSSLIQNAFYTLQGGFERGTQNLEDSRHGDNYFNYGYIGKFFQDYIPVVGVTEWEGGIGSANPLDPNIYGHVDYRPVFTGYEANTDINPVLANYNNLTVDATNGIQFPAQNGLFLESATNIWGNRFSNVGQVYNLNRQGINDVITFTATSSFDLVPGKSDDSRHSIEVGFWYEQRYDSRYSVAPRELWNLARNLANDHILGVDFDTEIGTVDLSEAGFNTFVETENLLGPIVQHDLLLDENSQSFFFRKIREATGVPINEFINIDEIDPNVFSLDMFTALDLIDAGLTNYYGYDYLGNKLANTVTFDDFFTAIDEEGRRTFPVAAFQPNYFAGYIQDKFTFNDITFRVGLRVDRYDANTKVLKDPYSLYEIKGAGDYFNENTGEERPGTIGDDFKVYLNDNGTGVEAYRSGDNWYDKGGTLVNNPVVIFGDGGFATPALVDDKADIRDPDFNPTIAFEDYKPQVNWMPRLAFSFPISDEANFFAHYDVLVQRPPSNTQASALDYFNFATDIPRNNPNLRPEKTVDYEVGFRQVVSKTSAIKIAIYYKELRDMIQSRRYRFISGSALSEYESFDNIDFGTVKGFTFQYDMRRTGNVSANINYTLQFADGTGSDAESNRVLNRRSNVRNLLPLSFDERHRLTASIDYRYFDNDGPELFGQKILQNFGANLQVIAVSGRPYTERTTPEEFGGTQFGGALNGARKPWTFTANLRLDKDFQITKGLGVNVYFRVSNLLNTRNVIDVYTASGSADTDGFLVSKNGQDAIRALRNNNQNLQAYLDSYQWAEANPDFFSLPRRIFLGAIFDF